MRRLWLFLFLLLAAACAEDPVVHVGDVESHEEALTHNWYGTVNADRICLHSTQNKAQGTKRWICGSDRAPTDVTAADVVNVWLDTGNDVAVVSGDDAANGGCNCTCNVNTGTYGAPIDYIYPSGTPAGSVAVKFMDSPTASGTSSGNDLAIAGGGPTGFVAFTGTNTYRGGPLFDMYTSNNCGGALACGSTDMIWDPAGDDQWDTYEGADWITDVDCSWAGCHCGSSTDTVNDCDPRCDAPDAYCENTGSIGPASCPGLPFP